ncbi:MAG TPA: 3-hydroxyacyl-CoA dehydrogenase, partial [Devosia sp.]
MAQPQLPPTKNWRFELDFEGIGWLTIDTPKAPVNTLSREAIAELETLVLRFEDLVAEGALQGVVLLSAKDTGFIAGADVSEFDQMSDVSVLPEALRRTHALFDRIENFKVP